MLSSAWKPNPKKSAEWRTHFQKSVHKVRDWDTRSPVYEKKQVTPHLPTHALRDGWY